MKDMVKKLITRPRLSSSTMVCRMVLLAAICDHGAETGDQQQEEKR